MKSQLNFSILFSFYRSQTSLDGAGILLFFQSQKEKISVNTPGLIFFFKRERAIFLRTVLNITVYNFLPHFEWAMKTFGFIQACSFLPSITLKKVKHNFQAEYQINKERVHWCSSSELNKNAWRQQRLLIFAIGSGRRTSSWGCCVGRWGRFLLESHFFIVAMNNCGYTTRFFCIVLSSVSWACGWSGAAPSPWQV